MTTTDATTRAITITIPLGLAPAILGKNGGHNWHWSKHARAFEDQAQWAANCISDQIACEELDTDTWPWRSAFMHIFWHYASGRPPDDDNAVARLSAVRDAFEALGVVTDDRHIRIGLVEFVRVPRGTDPYAQVTLEED